MWRQLEVSFVQTLSAVANSRPISCFCSNTRLIARHLPHINTQNKLKYNLTLCFPLAQIGLPLFFKNQVILLRRLFLVFRLKNGATCFLSHKPTSNNHVTSGRGAFYTIFSKNLRYIWTETRSQTAAEVKEKVAKQKKEDCVSASDLHRRRTETGLRLCGTFKFFIY